MNPERRKRLTRVLDLALVLALAAILVAGILTAQKLRRHLSTIQATLGQLEQSLTGGPTALAQILQDPGQLSALQDTISTLDSELAAIEKMVNPLRPLAPYLGWLPIVGGDVQAAPHLLDMVRGLTNAASSLSNGLLPIVERLDPEGSGLTSAGPAFIQAAPHIDSAHKSLSRTGSARKRVDAQKLSPSLRSMVDRLDSYWPELQTGLQAATLLPDLIGGDGPRTYLLLAQNNHELRATGGFISGVGTVRFEDGVITQVHLQDSYTVDDLSQPHPPAPGALRRHMGAELLLLRDANWWPDFPTSAQAIAALYLQDQGVQVDGVISVDLTALRLLLDATGPISVPGYDQPISSHNLEKMIMTYWQAPLQTAPGKEQADWWQHRKDLAADLMATLFDHLGQEVTAADLAHLASAFIKALQESHTIIYVKDPNIMGQIDALRWGGAQRRIPGDYLMVVDSNVGFNKVNPNIRHTQDYQVQLSGDGLAQSLLTLTYEHLIDRPTPACIHGSYYGESYQDLMERCYWNHVRIYIPAGSEVLEVSGADQEPEIRQENTYTVIATSFLLENGQARTLQIRYRPHQPTVNDLYWLYVQKQPGTDAHPLRVSITPPAGAQPAFTPIEDLHWLDGRAVWQGNLDQDRRFEFAWKKGD